MINKSMWETVCVPWMSSSRTIRKLEAKIAEVFPMRSDLDGEHFAGYCLRKHLFQYLVYEYVAGLRDRGIDPGLVQNVVWANHDVAGVILWIAKEAFKLGVCEEEVARIRDWKIQLPGNVSEKGLHPEYFEFACTRTAELVERVRDRTTMWIDFFQGGFRKERSNEEEYRARVSHFRRVPGEQAIIQVYSCIVKYKPWNFLGNCDEPLFLSFRTRYYADISIYSYNSSLIEGAFEYEARRLGDRFSVREFLDSAFYVLLMDDLRMDQAMPYNWYNSARDETTPFSLRVGEQVVLHRIAERIGRRKRGRQTEISEVELKWLRHFFEILYERIEKGPPVSVSLAELLAEETKAALTFGLITTKLVPVKQFRIKKELAELGYGFQEEIATILNGSLPEVEQGLGVALKRLFCEFIEWYDEYPELAIDMMSSIWHGVGVFQSDDWTKATQTGLTGKYFSYCLLRALGEGRKRKACMQEKYLKFVCLWEACHYLPYLAELAKGIDLTSKTGLLKTGGRLVKVKIGERVIKGVPAEWAGDVALVAEVVRGEGIYRVLETSAKLQLLGVAAQIGGWLWNPRNMWKRMKMEALGWWRPLRSGWKDWRVVAVHVGVPVAGIVAAVWCGLGVLGALFVLGVTWKVYGWLRGEVPYAEVLLEDRQMAGEVKREVLAYLQNAKRMYSMMREMGTKRKESEAANERVRVAMVALEVRMPGSAGEAVKFFNEEMQKERLESQEEENYALKEVEEKWLQPVLMKLFMEDACKFYWDDTHASEFGDVPKEREWSYGEMKGLVQKELGGKSYESESVVQALFVNCG